jgi:monofunctional biosynthetic peptidoglycan transglycosylase
MKIFRRLVFWLIGDAAVTGAAIAGLLLLQIAWWVDFNPSSTSFMRHQLSVLQEKNPNAKLQHQWVPYDRISNNLKRAVIAF